jgi:hypothetical protein
MFPEEIQDKVMICLHAPSLMKAHLDLPLAVWPAIEILDWRD